MINYQIPQFYVALMELFVPFQNGILLLVKTARGLQHGIGQFINTTTYICEHLARTTGLIRHETAAMTSVSV